MLETACWRIQPDESVPIRPVPIQMEGCGDFKACLTDPYPVPEGEEPPADDLPLPCRTWSLWRQTDPVALFNGKVAPGVPDYTVAYANNMFVFENEDNMKAFMKDPKKYLKAPPKMPKEFRMLILGPRGMGMHT